MLAIAVLSARRGAWGVLMTIAVGIGLAGAHRHAALSAVLGLFGLAVAIVASKLYGPTPPERTVKWNDE
jgi:hypothetical protein